MRVFVFAAAAFGLSLASAVGQPLNPLLGPWEFQTEPYADGCSMRGSVTIVPGRAANAAPLACTMVAYETCSDLKVRAEQTCEVRQRGDAVEIVAAVQKVEPRVGYAPDNFSLKVVKPGELMRGLLNSASTAPAEFVRPRPVPVS